MSCGAGAAFLRLGTAMTQIFKGNGIGAGAWDIKFDSGNASVCVGRTRHSHNTSFARCWSKWSLDWPKSPGIDRRRPRLRPDRPNKLTPCRNSANASSRVRVRVPRPWRRSRSLNISESGPAGATARRPPPITSGCLSSPPRKLLRLCSSLGRLGEAGKLLGRAAQLALRKSNRSSKTQPSKSCVATRADAPPPASTRYAGYTSRSRKRGRKSQNGLKESVGEGGQPGLEQRIANGGGGKQLPGRTTT